MPTERDHRAIEQATLYRLRLLIDSDDKEHYTKAEILKWIDQVARAQET